MKKRFDRARGSTGEAIDGVGGALVFSCDDGPLSGDQQLCLTGGHPRVDQALYEGLFGGRAELDGFAEFDGEQVDDIGPGDRPRARELMVSR
jgi:hypothetical protein